MNKSKLTAISIAILSALFVAAGFQNCAQDMQFADIKLNSILGTIDDDDVICDPLSAVANCDLTSEKGLVGYLYYLTDEQAPLIQGSDLRNTVLADYINYGYKANKVILMTGIEVEPQSWTTGFQQANGQMVKDNKGNDLFEWFSLDLYGFISLPVGSYEFAMVSDDGMLVEMNDTVVLNDDGLHSPRWKCSSDSLSFQQDEKKLIHIQYFQGPRTQVAMKLMYRPATGSTSCDKDGDWMLVPRDAYSHI